MAPPSANSDPPQNHKEETNLNWEARFAEFCRYQQCSGQSSAPPDPSLVRWIDRQRHDIQHGKLSAERVLKLNSVEFFTTIYNLLIPQQQQQRQQQQQQEQKLAGVKRPRSWQLEPSKNIVATETNKANFVSAPANGTCFSTTANGTSVSTTANDTSVSTSDKATSVSTTSKATSVSTSAKDTSVSTTAPPAQGSPQRNGNAFPDDVGLNQCKVQGEKWLGMYEELKLYRSLHGDCEVAKTYVSPKDQQRGGAKLGYWVCYQRQMQRNGVLSEERVKLLDKIGFRWLPERYNEMIHERNNAKWTRMYQELKRYHAEHGHCRIPRSFTTYKDCEADQLGDWVHQQRRLFGEKRLTQERIELLTKLDRDWLLTAPPEQVSANCLSANDSEDKDIHAVIEESATYGPRWLVMYKELRLYHAQYGDCRVPRKYVSSTGVQTGDSKLGSWVHNQRVTQIATRLSSARYRLLDKLDFWERGRDLQWIGKVVGKDPMGGKDRVWVWELVDVDGSDNEPQTQTFGYLVREPNDDAVAPGAQPLRDSVP